MKNHESTWSRVALINDLSCFGKCSLTVALPILAHYGIEAVPLPTALLSTHTAPGFEGYYCHPFYEELSKITEHWKSLKLGFDCIYTGYLCGEEQVSFAKKFIEDFATDKTKIIVDPVMGDNGRLYSGFSDDFPKAMHSLCALADVITPNRTEAALLCDLPTNADPAEFAKKLPGKAKIITSIGRSDEIGYYVKTPDECFGLFEPYLPKSLHGCGDVFASVFCGEWLSGQKIETAVKNAALFVNEAIRETEALDGHWYGLAFEKVLENRRKQNRADESSPCRR